MMNRSDEQKNKKDTESVLKPSLAWGEGYRRNTRLTSCKSAEHVSRYKFLRREPGRDGKILRGHGRDGNVAVGGIGNLAH